MAPARIANLIKAQSKGNIESCGAFNLYIPTPLSTNKVRNRLSLKLLH